MLDRTTGKLISAKNYVPEHLGSRIDLKTGRPVGRAGRLRRRETAPADPGYGGGHNWNPMSYSPLTGLVYLPAMSNGWWCRGCRRTVPVLDGRTTLAPASQLPRAAQATERGRGLARQGLPARLGPGEAAGSLPHTLDPARRRRHPVTGRQPAGRRHHGPDAGHLSRRQWQEAVGVGGAERSRRGPDHLQRSRQTVHRGQRRAGTTPWSTDSTRDAETFTVGPARLVVFALGAQA